MIVRELIAILGDLPQDLMVVHSTGTMQDRDEVTGYLIGGPADRAWTAGITEVRGPWVELI